MNDTRLLSTIRAEIEETGRKLELPQETCTRLASRIEDSLMRDFGGSRVYVPAKPRAYREDGLRLLRQGIPPAKVARKLRVHVSTIYRWYKLRPVLDSARLDYPPKASRQQIIR